RFLDGLATGLELFLRLCHLGLFGLGIEVIVKERDRRFALAELHVDLAECVEQLRLRIEAVRDRVVLARILVVLGLIRLVRFRDMALRFFLWRIRERRARERPENDTRDDNPHHLAACACCRSRVKISDAKFRRAIDAYLRYGAWPGL